jgi:hypothetical protein
LLGAGVRGDEEVKRLTDDGGIDKARGHGSSGHQEKGSAKEVFGCGRAKIIMGGGDCPA